jgi:leader peptidase (prepilin peptidase)/N-methyltransferase
MRSTDRGDAQSRRGRVTARGRTAGLALVTAAVGVGVVARLHDSWALPAFLALALVLPVLAWIDVERLVLPNRIVYPLTAVVFVLLVVGAIGDDNWGALVRALLGGVVAFAALVVLHVISPQGMGFGDVKLAFVLGLALTWLGWGELVVGFVLAFVYGAVVSLALVATGVRGRRDHVPFGPFLAAGALTAVVWGDTILVAAA